MASVLLLPFLLTWGETSRRSWFYRILAILFGLATLITQTLTGVVALGPVMLVWLVQRRSRRLVDQGRRNRRASWWRSRSRQGSAIVCSAKPTGSRTGNWYRLLSARGDGWTAAGEMIRDHRDYSGSGRPPTPTSTIPNRLAWLTQNGGTGGRDELASHFQWAHCDPLQMVAELGVPGIAWMALLLLGVVTARTDEPSRLPLTAAAAAPFLLLHYPTHLAVGLIPIGLCHRPHDRPHTTIATFNGADARVPVAIAVVVLAAAGAFWQLRRVAVDVWMGGLEMRMALAQARDPGSREPRWGPRSSPRSCPVSGGSALQSGAVLRTLGRASPPAGDAAGAETAFRASFDGLAA